VPGLAVPGQRLGGPPAAMGPGSAQVTPGGSAYAIAPAAAGPCWGREYLDDGGCWEDDGWDPAGSLTAPEIAALAALDRAAGRAGDWDDGLRDAAPMALDPWPAGPRLRAGGQCSPGVGPVEVLPGLMPRHLGAGGGFDAGGVADRVPPGPLVRVQRRPLLPPPPPRQASQRVAAVTAQPGRLRLVNATRAQLPNRARSLPSLNRDATRLPALRRSPASMARPPGPTSLVHPPGQASCVRRAGPAPPAGKAWCALLGASLVRPAGGKPGAPRWGKPGAPAGGKPGAFAGQVCCARRASLLRRAVWRPARVSAGRFAGGGR
jgi:hypothetical protein